VSDREKQLAASRPNFADRFELRFSTGRRVDGLWIGTFESNADAILLRVEDALRLIKTHDPRRYYRLTRDLDRIWVRLLPGPLARFSYSLRACELDTRFVLAESSVPEMIAATIVHEATHARLWRRGIQYREEARHRVEAACLRRELAFAARLPNGTAVRDQAERALETPPGFWTSAAFSERELDGTIQALRHLGTPKWIVRALLALRAVRIALITFARCLTGRLSGPA
jgi:hypothetical protein